MKKPILFKNEKYLDINYSSEILHRQDEISQLMILYSSLITNPGAYSVNQFIYGKVGVGKTATIKYFANELVEIASKHEVPLTYIHVNCRREKTSYKALIHILRTFNPKFPKRGYSFQDLVDAIKEYLNQLQIHLLVVLDELDYILENDGDILYSLTRLYDDSTNQLRRLSIIGILRGFSSIQGIYFDIRDYFQKNVIEFKSYSKEQLYNILRFKAKKSFIPGAIEDNIIEFIVSLLVHNGDLRHGMNILWRAGKNAENRELTTITKECVEIANHEIFPFGIQNCLKFMTKEKLVFLLGVVKVLNSTNRQQTTIKEVLIIYHDLCKKLGSLPKSYSQIWNYIQEYKKEDLIKVKVESEKIRGRRSILETGVIPLPALEDMIIDLLNTRGVHI